MQTLLEATGAARRRAVSLVVVLLLLATCAAAHADDRSMYTAAELALIEQQAAPSVALPADLTDHVADNPEAAALGQYLFFDRRLSVNDAFSCASCHQPRHAFTDGRTVAKALGIETRNTPTVINAAYNQWFFWDGRADTMWAQVLQVIENPLELGGDRLAVAHTIDRNGALRRAYVSVFGPLPPLANSKRFPAHGRPNAPAGSAGAKNWSGMDGADKNTVNRVFSNVGKAIEAYERRLVSRNSPFDRYAHALRTGDRSAQALLPPAAKRGLKLFVGRGECELCHNGPNFTDGQFHNLGLPLLPGEAVDTGREGGIRFLRSNPFNAAGPYSDQRHGQAAERLTFLPAPANMRGAFKTPSLRNVARTGPYLHDGRFSTLRQVVQFYADGKAASQGRLVGKREGTLALVPHFTASQISDLVAFLKTLNSAPLPSSLTTAPLEP